MRTDDASPPLLTVAMPVFNAGELLRPAVLSVIRQTFTDWELLLIDDGSTDGSVETAKEVFDVRVRVIRDGANRGLAARLNEAVDSARGQFIARMDQDDICHPERFSLQLERLRADPSLDLVGTRCMTISATAEILGTLPFAASHQAICARPWLGFYLPHPSWMGRTRWFRKHRYATPGPYCCEDQELLLRAHAVSHFETLPHYLVAYRVRDRINWRKSWRTRTTLLGVQCRHFSCQRDYLDGILAVAACALRVGADVLRVLRQNFRRSSTRRIDGPAPSDAVIETWRALLEDLGVRQESS